MADRAAGRPEKERRGPFQAGWLPQKERSRERALSHGRPASILRQVSSVVAAGVRQREASA